MLIARFGSTWAGATVLPTNEASDDWVNSTVPTVVQAGAAGGVFDFAGDKSYPLQPITVGKTLTVASSTWAGVEPYVDTYKGLVGYGRNKLWGLCRDGSHRWAWAKCVEVNASEKPKQYHTYPIAMKFYLPEGVWYAENLTSHVFTHAAPVAVLNGTWFAYPTFTIAVTVGTINAFTLSDVGGRWSLTYTHDITAAHSVAVNSAALSCTHTGVTNAYQYLTIPTGQFPWAWIIPVGMSIQLAVTYGGSLTYTCTVNHYATYL